MKKILLTIILGLFIIGITGTAHAAVFTYEYKLRTYAEAEPIKNLLIQLSDGTFVTNIVAGSGVTNSTGTFTSGDLPRLPTSMYGINFVVPYGAHEFSIKFDSTNAPVWGDFFANSWCFDYDPNGAPGIGGLGFAYNNENLGFYIPRPDGGGTSVPSANWIGLLTNIDNNSNGQDLSGLGGAYGNRINEDSGLYVAGDKWYYQANDSIGGGTGTGGIYHDDGWVELDWKVTSSVVPEPATMVLFGLGSAAMVFARRKKRIA